MSEPAPDWVWIVGARVAVGSWIQGAGAAWRDGRREAARPRAAPLSGRLRLFIAAVSGGAALLWLGLAWARPLGAAEWRQVAFWIALGLVAHAGEFELPRAGSVNIYLSAGFAMSAAAIAALPPAGAMAAVALGSLTVTQITRSSRPLVTVLFNRGALALCAAAGSAVFQPVSAALPLPATLRLIGGSLAASSVYFALSVLLTGCASALRAGRPVGRPWEWPLGFSPALLWNYVALGLLGDLILTMLRLGQVAGLLLALIPLAVSYYSLRQSANVRRLYDAIVATLVDSLDLRDRDTGGHTRRVAELAVRLGRKLGLRGQELDDLRAGALLHDLGKIGVADSILLKPGPLTPEEWREMRRHPDLGARLLEAHGLLHRAIPLIRHHQEKYDGTGYPAGLAGEAIPLGSRIITVADSFMAMVDGRPYRPGRPPAEAYAELRRMAGAQFDPRVVAALAPADWETVFSETPLGLDVNSV